jgi:2-polyprenyl-3-methyl-5-hydroxy-6-metoxy-1,4-benzoquinol methylase
MLPEIIKNKYGFYEIKNKPGKDELKEYYSNKYYKEEAKYNKYQKSYSDKELLFLTNRLNRKYHVLLDHYKNLNKYKFLDIGCGEGWGLKFFSEKGLLTTGIDYTSEPASWFGNIINNNLIPGDIFDNIDNLIEQEFNYNIILLDNVLEHVIDPEQLINQIRFLLDDQGTLIVEVPNDFSVLQQWLINSKNVRSEYWVGYPDHLSYFNYEGLKNLFELNGWKTLTIKCDFPIDINLLNSNTNYIDKKEKGKSVHFARIDFENLLDEISVEETVKLYTLLAKMGLGRNLIGFFIPDNQNETTENK